MQALRRPSPDTALQLIQTYASSLLVAYLDLMSQRAAFFGFVVFFLKDKFFLDSACTLKLNLKDLGACG